MKTLPWRAAFYLLVLGYLLPAPHPAPLILRIAGWIFTSVGLVLLLVGLATIPT